MHLTPSTNIYPHVSRQQRESKQTHRGHIIWLTGLSGSGKSSLAHAIESRLHDIDCRTFILDGDNLRQGLCNDLGFSLEDRSENIRRVSEVAKLFLEAGTIVLISLISPLLKDRQYARELVPSNDFLEVFCNAPLPVCEERDVKGLYQKARQGLIPNFTGISSPYEPPNDPDITLNTANHNIEHCVNELIELLQVKGII